MSLCIGQITRYTTGRTAITITSRAICGFGNVVVTGATGIYSSVRVTYSFGYFR